MASTTPDSNTTAVVWGFVVDIEGKPSNRIVRQGLEILMNLRHRGAKGAEANTGDGAGILLQIPHAFFEQEFQKDNMRLPAPGEYGVGMVFLPSRDSEAQKIQSLFEDAVYRSGQILLGMAGCSHRQLPDRRQRAFSRTQNPPGVYRPW